MRSISATLLDPFCRPANDRQILDAGCGTGGNLDWLKRYAGNGNVIGLDLESAALLFCRQRHHKYLIQGSTADLPFPEEIFDLVTSFDVLVQLPGDSLDERALHEIYRVLKPGGITFIRVAAYQWMHSGHDIALGTQRRYTLSELRIRMERAGFEILRATYANSLLLPIVAFRRLLLKRIGLADSGSDVKPLPRQLEWVNRALTEVLNLEARSLNLVDLPFGLSIICVAQKPQREYETNENNETNEI